MEERIELLLEDGERIEGWTRGYVPELPVSGEIVFTTSPVGYVEAITEPSYYGQILVFAFPEIGNYGVEEAWMESARPQVRAVVVSRLTDPGTNAPSLREFLDTHKVPYIEGVDTRALIVKIREQGTMLGVLGRYPLRFDGEFYDSNKEFVHPRVSVERPVVVSEGTPRIMLVDCGVKRSIVRRLVDTGLGVIQVPCTHPFHEEEWDGLFLSNGPGNPSMVEPVIARLPEAIRRGRPIAGVCLGQQLIALAEGLEVYKLPYGHRGQNQPVIRFSDSRAFVTSQNHGWAIREEGLGPEWIVTHRNLNDGSIEGIRHRDLPVFAVQYHPEGRPGPLDSVGFFEEFAQEVKKR